MAGSTPFRRRRRRRPGRPSTAGRLRLALLGGVLLGLAAFESGRFPPALPTEAGAETPARAAGALRVVDGDTFVLDGVRIRIADIDTPEVQGRCPYETALAARATARTRMLLAPRNFDLHPLPGGRDEDRYGRKLRIVTVSGRSVGDVLVAEGLARTWSGRREPWCG